MRLPPPATSTLASLLTPSLLVSLPVLERNEAACRALMRGTGVQLRPHAKAHKSSGLARWLLARGGDELSGLCAQTVDEAEVMVGAAQCKDVLLTNEVIGPQKLERLAGLAASHPDAAIGVLVDSLFGVDALSAAMRARAPSATISAYVEIECGQDRCGVPAASPSALAIAQAVAAAPGLRLGGLHVYHGGIQHVRTTDDRRAAVANGLEVPVVTGAGTGTFQLEIESGTHTEVQPGSYLFMDGDYGANQEAQSLFGQSLFVHATVISADEAAGRRVVDAGTKAIDMLCGLPKLAAIDETVPLAPGLEGVGFRNGGDEHGILTGVPPGLLPIGSTVQLAPSHCDPTVNLHEWIVGVRGGVVETAWPIDARGP